MPPASFMRLGRLDEDVVPWVFPELQPFKGPIQQRSLEAHSVLGPGWVPGRVGRMPSGKRRFLTVLRRPQGARLSSHSKPGEATVAVAAADSHLTGIREPASEWSWHSGQWMERQKDTKSLMTLWDTGSTEFEIPLAPPQDLLLYEQIN